ncbi:hypothetical protein GDO78_019188 [Eleutherodactylus coqui]|uniref:Uncharacterized protein n=1 Tax=Eleutherodactylus coqui TaxID=57060 RepID=A0A8J6JY58_ELECQ|nr:hypothetical protein GDO78_019188 [Eleutherodactylus coqui]
MVHGRIGVVHKNQFIIRIVIVRLYKLVGCYDNFISRYAIFLTLCRCLPSGAARSLYWGWVIVSTLLPSCLHIYFRTMLLFNLFYFLILSVL